MNRDTLINKILLEDKFPKEYKVSGDGILTVLEQDGTVGTINLNKPDIKYTIIFRPTIKPEIFIGFSYLGSYISYSFKNENKTYLQIVQTDGKLPVSLVGFCIKIDWQITH